MSGGHVGRGIDSSPLPSKLRGTVHRGEHHRWSPRCLHLVSIGNQQQTVQVWLDVANSSIILRYVARRVNVNVRVYSPDIPVSSTDCVIYTPGSGMHSFTVLSRLGRI